jgi:integrase
MHLHLRDWPSLLSNTRHWPAAWVECLEHYLQNLYDKSGSFHTCNGYMHCLARFYGDVPDPEHVSRQDVERFIHAPRHQIGLHHGEEVAASTRNVRVSILASWYTFASSYTIASEDGPVPLYRFALPTAGMKRSQPALVYRQLSDQEVHQFFASIDTSTIMGARDYSLFLAYLYTSRRLQEIATLTWGNLAPYTFPGGRSGMVYFFRNKGRSQILDSDEWPERVHTALLAYLGKSGRLATMDSDSPLWVAIPHPTNGGLPRDPWQPLHRSSIWLRFCNICKAAGIPKDRRCIHSWRHTSSRIRYESGEDLVSISKHLRHKSLQTTGIYMASLSSGEDKGARLLASRFGDL